jgi:BirA family transcriptional regulator, biotin operon repressor / biotin---[acetyl-CoA-carboxylase] ligase
MTPDATARPPLDAARLPDRVEVLEATPSTNAVVAERARAGEPEGLVVVAEHQQAGRGRLDRTWVTPPRTSLTFSLLLRPDLPAAQWPWIPLWTGYAVHAALAAHVPGLGLKWPNDLLVDGRKVAGILLERVETPDGPAAVVGVGLNVSQTRDELPVEQATSLALETGAAPDRTGVLTDVLASLEGHRGLLARREELRAAYAGACVTLGSELRVEVPGGVVVEGRGADVDADGQLVVDTADGPVAVRAGDVVHVRPRSVS